MSDLSKSKKPDATGESTDSPTVTDFYLRLSLYRTSGNLEKESLKHYFELLYYAGTLDCHCVYCKSDSVFSAQLPEFERDLLSKARNNYKLLVAAPMHAPIGRGGSGTLMTHPYSAFSLPRGVTFRTFACTRDFRHVMYFVYLSNEVSIQKIGQHPSYADITLSGESRYRKVLGELFPELRRAVGLHSHGVGIGAFVYLRRIFESLVDDAHSIAVSDKKQWKQVQEKAYARATRMADRIRLLKNTLPTFMVENADIYGILSDGVHNLTEEQCLKHFDTVRNGIELMLEQKLSADEQRERLIEGTRAVAELRKHLSDSTPDKK